MTACGSSSNTGSASSSSTSASAAAGAATAGRSAANRTKLVACLKSHGVTLPSRPAGAPAGGGYGAGGGGGGTPPAGTRRPGAGGGFFGGGGRFANNPKLQAAFKACGAQGFGAGARRFSLNHAAVTKFVACVKQHGYTLPAPNFSGKGSIFPAGIQKQQEVPGCLQGVRGGLAAGRGCGGWSGRSRRAARRWDRDGRRLNRLGTNSAAREPGAAAETSPIEWSLKPQRGH